MGQSMVGRITMVALTCALAACADKKPPETPTSGPATGKPTVAPPQQAAVQKAADENQGGSLSISAEILKLCPSIKPPKFGFDSAAVKDEWTAAIQSLADCMQTGGLKGKGVLLTGHTDPRGDDDYNMALGTRRASAVKDAVTSFGVGGDRVDVTSRGEVDAKGTDEQTWAQDRRVDIGLRPGS